MHSQETGRLAEDVIARTWQKRRAAERTPRGVVVGMGLAAAGLVGVTVNPDEFPGSLPVAAAVAAAMIALLGLMAWIVLRRLGARGHSGSLNVAPWGGGATPWWRSPVLLGPALVTAVFVGRMLGVFDHLAGILTMALLVAAGTAWAILATETLDPIYGHNPVDPPVLSGEARAAAGQGEPESDVLELLALQGHNSERRISWCAHVLDTDEADIRERIARGRRWLELPATDVHNLSTAKWVRLTEAGRRALVSP